MNGDQTIGFEWICRQWQQTGLFLAKDLFNPTGIILWPRTLVGDFLTPDLSLAIEVFQRRKRARGKERIPDVTNDSFDPPLSL